MHTRVLEDTYPSHWWHSRKQLLPTGQEQQQLLDGPWLSFTSKSR